MKWHIWLFPTEMHSKCDGDNMANLFLIKKKSLSRFAFTWKLLVDFLLETIKNETSILGFDD